MTTATDHLPLWQLTWRKGIAPQLSTEQLQRVHAALKTDDDRLITNATTYPPPLSCMADVECDGACPVGFAAMVDGATVGQVEEFFARVCHQCDMVIGEPAACRFFVNWADDTGRDIMRQLLADEIKQNLAERQAA